MHSTLRSGLLLQWRCNNAHSKSVPTRHVWIQRGRRHCPVQRPVPQWALWRHCRANQQRLHCRMLPGLLLPGRQHQCHAIHVPSRGIWECGRAVLAHVRGRVPAGALLPPWFQSAHALPCRALWLCHWRHQRCLHGALRSGLCMRSRVHLAAAGPLPCGKFLPPWLWRSAPAKLPCGFLLRPWKRSSRHLPLRVLLPGWHKCAHAVPPWLFLPHKL